MKKTLIIACLNLSGCFYQSVNEFELETARKTCADAGIANINSIAFGGVSIYCKDGKQYFMDNNRLRARE